MRGGRKAIIEPHRHEGECGRGGGGGGDESENMAPALTP